MEVGGSSNAIQQLVQQPADRADALLNAGVRVLINQLQSPRQLDLHLYFGLRSEGNFEVVSKDGRPLRPNRSSGGSVAQSR